MFSPFFPFSVSFNVQLIYSQKQKRFSCLALAAPAAGDSKTNWKHNINSDKKARAEMLRLTTST